MRALRRYMRRDKSDPWGEFGRHLFGGAEYEQQYTGEIVTIEKEGVYLACCHCGLVHLVEPLHGKDVGLRWSLDPNETASRRRYLAFNGKLKATIAALRRLL